MAPAGGRAPSIAGVERASRHARESSSEPGRRARSRVDGSHRARARPATRGAGRRRWPAAVSQAQATRDDPRLERDPLPGQAARARCRRSARPTAPIHSQAGSGNARAARRARRPVANRESSSARSSGLSSPAGFAEHRRRARRRCPTSCSLAASRTSLGAGRASSAQLDGGGEGVGGGPVGVASRSRGRWRSERVERARDCRCAPRRLRGRRRSAQAPPKGPPLGRSELIEELLQGGVDVAGLGPRVLGHDRDRGPEALLGELERDPRCVAARLAGAPGERPLRLAVGDLDRDRIATRRRRPPSTPPCGRGRRPAPRARGRT